MGFVALLEAARRNRIGEDEEGAFVAELGIETFNEQPIFVVEHRPKADAADVTIGCAIDRVAELHIVSRHGFCYGAGSTANMEESPRYLLAGPDFCKGPIAFRIKIDLERFLAYAEVHLLIHQLKMKAFA